MRIRQLIAALMVLLSLTAQARTAMGCGMMPAAVAACCCADQGHDRCAQGAAAASCCDLVAPADALFAQAAVDGKALKYFKQAPAGHVAAGPAPHLLPASFDSGGGARPAPEPAAFASVLPLYLVTSRLRL